VQLSVVRHGETIFNQQARLTGQLDIPLNTVGQHQAQLVGAYLANRPFDVIVASDLQRAQTTAQAIARYHDLPVQADADLREILLGSWEGHTFADITRTEPEQAHQWRTQPAHFAPEGGETLEEVQLRVQYALERWYTQFPDGNVVWVTHGGLIGILICHLLKLDLNRRRQFHHGNASLSEFTYTLDEVSILRLNETAYLQVAQVPLADSQE
jgi:Fructose-2,6-bisphosphatase